MQSPSLWLDPGPHLLLILFLSILYLIRHPHLSPQVVLIVGGGWSKPLFLGVRALGHDAVLNLGLLNKSVHGYSEAKKHWDVPEWLTWVPYVFLCYAKKPFILLLV